MSVAGRISCVRVVKGTLAAAVFLVNISVSRASQEVGCEEKLHLLGPLSVVAEALDRRQVWAFAQQVNLTVLQSVARAQGLTLETMQALWPHFQVWQEEWIRASWTGYPLPGLGGVLPPHRLWAQSGVAAMNAWLEAWQNMMRAGSRLASPPEARTRSEDIIIDRWIHPRVPRPIYPHVSFAGTLNAEQVRRLNYLLQELSASMYLAMVDPAHYFSRRADILRVLGDAYSHFREGFR